MQGPTQLVREITPLSQVHSPLIWVACRSAYAAGSLHGCWLKAATSEEELETDVEHMLDTSPSTASTGYALLDTQGFLGIPIDENEALGRIAQLASLIRQHGSLFSAWYLSFDGELFESDQLEDRFIESYAGTSSSVGDFFQDELEASGAMHHWPSLAREYFDFESYGETAIANGEIRAARVGADFHFFYTQ